MNYVERHFGDWARDTAHLSMLEDGAYNRLVDLYYVREEPLPLDLSACCRLVRAFTKPERDAVRVVLGEFFEQTSEGWRHKRCDLEIERYRSKSGKARASANARWGADRPQSGGNATAYANASTDAMRTHSERRSNAMPHAGADARAPTPQAPVTSNQAPSHTQDGAGNPDAQGEAEGDHDKARHSQTPERPAPTPAAQVCLALRHIGMSRVNPGNPLLLALIEAGATLDEFTGAAPRAMQANGDPFAYLLAIVEGQRKDAAKRANGLHRGPMPPPAPQESPAARAKRERYAEMSGGLVSRPDPAAKAAAPIAENVDARPPALGLA